MRLFRRADRTDDYDIDAPAERAHVRLDHRASPLVDGDSWAKAWSTACVGTKCLGLYPHFANSILVVVPATAISTIIGAVNGFALTKVKFRGANTVFTLIWLGCFIPYQAVIIPTAQVLGMLGLSGGLVGLSAVYTIYGIPFTTLFSATTISAFRMS